MSRDGMTPVAARDIRRAFGEQGRDYIEGVVRRQTALAQIVAANEQAAAGMLRQHDQRLLKLERPTTFWQRLRWLVRGC